MCKYLGRQTDGHCNCITTATTATTTLQLQLQLHFNYYNYNENNFNYNCRYHYTAPKQQQLLQLLQQKLGRRLLRRLRWLRRLQLWLQPQLQPHYNYSHNYTTSTATSVILLRVLQLSPCRSQCNSCKKFAWYRDCVRNTFVFCRSALKVLLELLHQGCNIVCRFSQFCEFWRLWISFENSFAKCFKLFSLALAPGPVLELQFLTLLCEKACVCV